VCPGGDCLPRRLPLRHLHRLHGAVPKPRSGPLARELLLRPGVGCRVCSIRAGSVGTENAWIATAPASAPLRHSIDPGHGCSEHRSAWMTQRSALRHLTAWRRWLTRVWRSGMRSTSDLTFGTGPNNVSVLSSVMTRWVSRQTGIALSRVAAQQATCSENVRSTAEPAAVNVSTRSVSETFESTVVTIPGSIGVATQAHWLIERSKVTV
jgi:hypothetical protein